MLALTKDFATAGIADIAKLDDEWGDYDNWARYVRFCFVLEQFAGRLT